MADRETDPILFDIGDPIGKAELVQTPDAPPKPYEVKHDKSVTPLPFEPLTGAAFSEDRMYRYGLWRRWQENGTTCLFVMLNPSTADEVKNDPTVERCERYAKAWGHGRLLVANIFAFRATDPKKLKWALDPIGPDNDAWIKKFYDQSNFCVCAWGNHGMLFGRQLEVSTMLRARGKIHVFGMTKKSSPKHPLYLKKCLTPVEI